MKTLGKLLILISAYIAEGCKLAWYHICLLYTSDAADEL